MLLLLEREPLFRAIHQQSEYRVFLCYTHNSLVVEMTDLLPVVEVYSVSACHPIQVQRRRIGMGGKSGK